MNDNPVTLTPEELAAMDYLLTEAIRNGLLFYRRDTLSTDPVAHRHHLKINFLGVISSLISVDTIHSGEK